MLKSKNKSTTALKKNSTQKKMLAVEIKVYQNDSSKKIEKPKIDLYKKNVSLKSKENHAKNTKMVFKIDLSTSERRKVSGYQNSSKKKLPKNTCLQNAFQQRTYTQQSQTTQATSLKESNHISPSLQLVQQQSSDNQYNSQFKQQILLSNQNNGDNQNRFEFMHLKQRFIKKRSEVYKILRNLDQKFENIEQGQKSKEKNNKEVTLEIFQKVENIKLDKKSKQIERKQQNNEKGKRKECISYSIRKLF